MNIIPAQTSDFDSAIDCLVEAFVDDGHMKYLFGANVAVRHRNIREFFSVLLAVRFALTMPVLVAKSGNQVAGLVMGYDTTRPEWPPQLADRWSLIWAQQQSMKERLDRVDVVSEKFKPALPHYYLGAIAVTPTWQGKGVGGALIKAFCQTSDDDKMSRGTYLETGESTNAAYYRARGFQLSGQDLLDGQFAYYCMFRPKPAVQLA